MKVSGPEAEIESELITQMEAQQYKTKAGVMQYRPVCEESEVMAGDGAGFCLACGAEASQCEPDARQYTCESCGKPKVYGLEELLMMGLLKIAGEGDGE